MVLLISLLVTASVLSLIYLLGTKCPILGDPSALASWISTAISILLPTYNLSQYIHKKYNKPKTNQAVSADQTWVSVRYLAIPSLTIHMILVSMIEPTLGFIAYELISQNLELASILELFLLAIAAAFFHYTTGLWIGSKSNHPFVHAFLIAASNYCLARLLMLQYFNQFYTVGEVFLASNVGINVLLFSIFGLILCLLSAMAGAFRSINSAGYQSIVVKVENNLTERVHVRRLGQTLIGLSLISIACYSTQNFYDKHIRKEINIGNNIKWDMTPNELQKYISNAIPYKRERANDFKAYLVEPCRLILQGEVLDHEIKKSCYIFEDDKLFQIEYVYCAKLSDINYNNIKDRYNNIIRKITQHYGRSNVIFYPSQLKNIAINTHSKGWLVGKTGIGVEMTEFINGEVWIYVTFKKLT